MDKIIFSVTCRHGNRKKVNLAIIAEGGKSKTWGVKKRTHLKFDKCGCSEVIAADMGIKMSKAD